MFLAWKEIKHSKGRYALIIGIIFLISYLTFFLTGLAYGLAQDGRAAADKWDASSIFLTKESDKNLDLSQFNKDEINQITASKKATLIHRASIAEVVNTDKKENVTLFGINANQFLAPNIIQGHMFKNDNEVVVNDSLIKDNGFKLNDEITLTGSDQKLKIVGVTDNAMFNVAPVIYMSPKTINTISGTINNPNINAIVVRGKDTTNDTKNLQKVSMSDFINHLPGYKAQVMTFAFMIGALIVISAIILGIFIYILTIQKKNIFGVMKVQGIAPSFIIKSVILQTFILATFGVVLGIICTLLTQLILPSSMPFALNSLFYLGITITMILFAVFGSFFSLRSIIKIDPLDALS